MELLLHMKYYIDLKCLYLLFYYDYRILYMRRCISYLPCNKDCLFQVYENVMKQVSENEDYKPAEWEKFSVLYMIYFIYNWGLFSCEMVSKTKAAEELREMIKNVKFDVIVQDVTLNQCQYGLWEVDKQFINKLRFSYIFSIYIEMPFSTNIVYFPYMLCVIILVSKLLIELEV